MIDRIDRIDMSKTGDLGLTPNWPVLFFYCHGPIN